jgi:hypothetical protein
MHIGYDNPFVLAGKPIYAEVEMKKRYPKIRYLSLSSPNLPSLEFFNSFA